LLHYVKTVLPYDVDKLAVLLDEPEVYDIVLLDDDPVFIGKIEILGNFDINLEIF
jgi:hypothetical protein